MSRRSPAALVALVLASFSLIIAMGTVASPASATRLTSGPTAPKSVCRTLDYRCVTGGYQATAATTGDSWAWRMYGEVGAAGIQTTSGAHNCTLYAAWRLQANGMGDPQRTWGAASQWGQNLPADQNAVAGSIAWWSATGGNHVAYVEQVNGDMVRVSADNFVGDGAYKGKGLPNSGRQGYTDSGWMPKTAPTGYLHPYPAGEGVRVPPQTGAPSASQQADPTKIIVSWPSVPGAYKATSYQYQYSKDGGKSWKRFSMGTRTSSPFTGTYGRTYIFQARAGNYAGWGAYSAYSNAVTVPKRPIPDEPAKPTASRSGTSTAINVSWPAVPRAAGYIIQYSRDGGKSWKGYGIGSRTSWTLNGQVGRTYIFQVQAGNESGWGRFSAYSNPVTLNG